MTTPTTDTYQDVYQDIYGGTGTSGDGGGDGGGPGPGDGGFVIPPPLPPGAPPIWRSKPQPHASAVVSLYLDSRDARGNPQLIDRFFVEPVTSGVSFNLYHSPTPPPPGTKFAALDDPLLPSLLAADGIEVPVSSDQGITFASAPGWLTLANQGAGTGADNPWWAGIEIMPAFDSSDTGTYVIADAGLLQLTYLGGEWAVTLPAAGGAILGSWPFSFAAGQRLQFVAGFDGTSFFAWSPLGALFHVPAAPPVPPAPVFRFGGALPGTYDMQVSAMSPAAWWKLADQVGSAVASDSSGNGLTGTAEHVAFSSEIAPGGQHSASFNGTSSKITTAYAPAGMTSLTLEAWCSFEGLGQPGASWIVADSDPATDHGGFALINDHGNPRAVFGTGSGAVTIQPATSPALDPEAWHHVVAAWDGTTAVLYADGQEVASGSFTGPLQPGAHPVTIGCDPAGDGFFAGNIADVAVYPNAFTAAQVRANYAASSRAPGRYILSSFVLKQEQASLDFTGQHGSAIPPPFSDFAADAARYVFPVLASDRHTTDNAVARFSTSFLLGAVCPWGFVGGLGSAYESCAWVPVRRDYKLARGYVEFDPVLAAAWKFEFTNLRPEPFEHIMPSSVRVNFMPTHLLPSRGQLSPTTPARLEPGMAVNQSVGPSITYSDTPPPSQDRPQGVPLPNEGMYAAQPEGVSQMASQGGSLYNLHTWQPPAINGGWTTAQPHYYRQAEIRQGSRVAYFVALSGIRMFRLDPTAADDTEMYLDTFADARNIDPGTLAPGGWSWRPGTGLVTPSNLAGAAQAESVTFSSAHAVTGIQFATVQSEPIQLLGDPDFSDPDFTSWAPVGDALPLRTSAVSSQLGSMTAVERSGNVLGGTFHPLAWGYLEKAYASWGDLMDSIPAWIDFRQPPVAATMGGIAYTGMPVPTTPAGRLYAAARVFAARTLTAPLYLQLLDGATGAVIAEASQVVSGGAVTEWWVGFTLGTAEVSSSTWADLEARYSHWSDIVSAPLTWASMDTSVTPVGATASVRLIQKDSTNDTWDVDNISIFEDALVWEFSNDGGQSWLPAFDIRNNPRGAITFPPALPGGGTKLRWRVSAFRPGVAVAALAIRPWYAAWPHGIIPRASGIGHGPNASPQDHFSLIEKDPRWQLSSAPLPAAWYFTVRQALGISVLSSDFPGPPLPAPDATLGDALVYERPAPAATDEPTWSDIYTDSYTATYSVADGGDIYTDVYSVTYGAASAADTGTAHSGAAALSAAATVSVTAVGIPRPVSGLGADLGPVSASDASVSAWASATGVAIPVRRIALGNQVPASLAASPAADDAGVRRVLFDFRPDATTSPGQLSDFLASCQAGGLQASVSLWSGADRAFSSPGDYLALVAQYAGAIRLSGHSHVFVIGNDSITNGLLPAWYPGDDLVDVIAPTFWCTGPAPGSGGDTLAVAGSFASRHGKPLGLAGFGVDRSRFSPAQGEAFLAYVAQVFGIRKAMGEINFDLVYRADGSYSLVGAPAGLISGYQAIAAVL